MRWANLILGVLLLICSGMSTADQPAMFDQVTIANTKEAEKYVGKILNDRGQHWSGFLVVPRGDSSYLKPGAQPLSGVFMRDEQGRKFFLLIERQSNEAGEKLDFVRGAIEIPEGLALGGHPIEDECIIKNYPQELIFVIGKEVNRYSKNGNYAGGDIRPIIKAWRVDFTAKKLVEIPAVNIKCEVGKNLGED